MEFIEALPDEICWECMLDWISANEPYRCEYWLDSWNSYALSIRVVVWMQQLAIRKLRPTQNEEQLILRSLLAQLRFLRKNLERDIDGNHLIKNAKALLWGSSWFDLSDCADWRKTGEQLTDRILSEQIHEDGMHFELSPAYHCQVFADLMECYQVVESRKLKKRLANTLPKMAQVVVDFTHPDGLISLFNDSGLHMAYSPGECMRVFQVLTGTSSSPNKHIIYPDAGYYGFRNNKHCVFLDCGPLASDWLPAHGHGDALSFEWSVGGRRIIIDPGVYEYDAGARRDYSRATSSNNTVTLDNADQSEFWKSFRVGRRARITRCEVNHSDSGIEVVGAHDGYKRMPGSPVHCRRFVIADDHILIHDEIEGGNSQTAIARLMLHPDCETQQITSNRILCTSDDVCVEISSSSPVRIAESMCFLDFGIEHRTQQLEFDLGSSPCGGTIELKIAGVR